MAGTCAGVAVTLVGHPFEVSRGRISRGARVWRISRCTSALPPRQPTHPSLTSTSHPQTLKVRLQMQPPGAGAIYSGVVDCARKTLAWEGPSGFYKGVSAPLAGQLVFRSVMFSVNAAWTRWASSLQAASGAAGPLPLYLVAAGGSLTWGVCTLIECPLQLASSQLQSQIVRQRSDAAYVAPYRGVLEYVRGAPAALGVRTALYTGVLPHLARNSIGGALHFGGFEAGRRAWAAAWDIPLSQVGLGANMLAGALGGILFWLPTYPADVVKSALQTDTLGPGRRYAGTADAVRQLWAEGGAARFTRGLSACMLRAVPANAVLLASATYVREAGYAVLAEREGLQ